MTEQAIRPAAPGLTITGIARAHRVPLVGIPLAAGVATFAAVTFLVAPIFTATATFMPPANQQSAAASVLASLGAIGGLAGTVAGVQTPADRYVSLMRSATVSNRIIERFQLGDVYGKELLEDARKELQGNVQLEVGKKDGLITISVDDKIPTRAAEIANQYIQELRALTAGLAMSEAQQRRKFFEARLSETRNNLSAAQQALAAAGYSDQTLRTEPRFAAETYAKQRAELAAAEINLLRLRQYVADNSPELRDAQTRVSALRAEVKKSEEPALHSNPAAYSDKYREYKYQESLFEIFSKQLEAARLDESKEGNLIQVIDAATAPEKKSKPRRGLISLGVALATLFSMLTFFILRDSRSPTAR